jgi:hypothetical protein
MAATGAAVPVLLVAQQDELEPAVTLVPHLGCAPHLQDNRDTLAM